MIKFLHSIGYTTLSISNADTKTDRARFIACDSLPSHIQVFIKPFYFLYRVNSALVKLDIVKLDTVKLNMVGAQV